MNKDVLYVGFETKQVENDNFYGFTLDGNGRYLLDDFTITHNSGKSFLAMIGIYNAQKDDPEAKQVWLDAEQTFNSSWAETLGIDTRKVVVVSGERATNGRECFELLLGVPKEDAKTHILAGKKKEGLLDKIASKELNINFIVLDSLGALIPPIEDVAIVGKAGMATLPRFLSKEFKKNVS